mgnify:CR=1 FL=1
MAFLGDFGKTFHKVIRNPVFQAVFPPDALAQFQAHLEAYAFDEARAQLEEAMTSYAG